LYLFSIKNLNINGFDFLKVVTKFWTMRFYHIEVGKLYTLDEFLQVQSTKKDTIELQMMEV